MSDKIKDTEKISENEEIIAEDLEDVSGGRAYIHDRPFRPMMKYGGPDMFRPELKHLTPEEQKKLEEEKKKKEREKKIEQILKLAREIDKESSTL